MEYLAIFTGNTIVKGWPFILKKREYFILWGGGIREYFILWGGGDKRIFHSLGWGEIREYFILWGGGK